MNKKSTLVIILIIAVILTGIYILNEKNADKNIPVENSDINIKTKVYFADETGSRLVGANVEFKVSDEVLKYEKSVNKLIDGPEGETLFKTVNSNTILNGVTVSGGLCVVDFSDTFVKYNTGGTLREMLCIYSIVNTLCEFEEIDKVTFTVNGENIKTFGQLDMSEPFLKDLTMVK